MRILLTGARGQLGRELLPLLSAAGDVVAVGHAECDFASPKAVRELVASARPTVIVNPAAYTAVNEAEANRELAFAINAAAPGALAEEAHKCGAMLVHYSTDYVFDGAKEGSYDEFDQPAPLNVYGASKLAGEHAVATAFRPSTPSAGALGTPGGRFLILRSRWIYGPGGNNFLLTIRRLAREREELRIVDDQVGGPTSSLQLAHATARIVREWVTASESDFPAGLYHATAGGSVSWFGFAQAIVDALIPNSPANSRKAEGEAQRGTPFRLQRIVPIKSAEHPTPARRPLNSVLCNFKFERTFGFCLANWELGLAEVVRELRRREGGAGWRDDASGSGSWNPGPARNLA